MKLKRLIDELLNPSLKCKRVGHDMKEQHRAGYYDDGRFRSVATEVTQSRKVCRRCGHAEDWTTVGEHDIQSFSGTPELLHNIRTHNSNDPYWMDYW